MIRRYLDDPEIVLLSGIVIVELVQIVRLRYILRRLDNAVIAKAEHINRARRNSWAN